MSGKKRVSRKKAPTSWEFDCPQFIDFAAGLEEQSPVNDIWFGEPNGRKEETPLSIKETNEEFGPKMATPKLKPFKSLKNSPYVNTERPVKTDDEKLAMLGKLPRRESKSENFINLIGQKLKSSHKLPVPVKGPMHRRSLSDCYIKTKKKLQPVTPMCLKRALNKGKNKKFKTTEELEMEQITKLQTELFHHLRLNEVNLKRIKENRAPYVMQKFNKICKTKASDDHAVKGIEVADRKVNYLEKKTGFQVRDYGARKDCAQSFKRKAKELQAILNPQPKPTTTHPNALKDINAVEEGNNHRVAPLTKYDAHSGVKFLPNVNKKTIPQPFSFDNSISKSFNNVSLSFKENDKLSASMRTPQLLINKENIHPTYSLAFVKTPQLVINKNVHPTNRLCSESKVENKVIRRT